MYENTRQYVIGLLVDLFKIGLSLIGISYVWYLLKYKFLTLIALPEILYRVTQYYADALIYYAILGIITLLFLVADKLIEQYDFTPTYQKGMPPSEVIIALAVSVIFGSAILFQAVTTGTIFEIVLLPRLILAFTNTLKAFIENMFFIGVIGFAIYKILTYKDFPSVLAAIISATIVGFIAAAWHLFQFHIVQVLVGPGVIFSVFLSKFMFFFLGTLLSLYYDNVWAMDIIHGSYNFIVTLIGKTLIPTPFIISYV